MKFLIFLSEAMVPLMIFYIVGFGLLSGRPVLDDFIDGAKDGMKTVAGILPTLVGLLVSVGVLRASGFLDFLGELLQMPAALLHIPPQIVPVVLVRLVSNSAATGLVLDIFKEYGTDSSLGLIASVLMSSTETVLYCLSVYFGSVGITRTMMVFPGDTVNTLHGYTLNRVIDYNSHSKRESVVCAPCIGLHQGLRVCLRTAGMSITAGRSGHTLAYSGFML